MEIFGKGVAQIILLEVLRHYNPATEEGITRSEIEDDLIKYNIKVPYISFTKAKGFLLKAGYIKVSGLRGASHILSPNYENIIKDLLIPKQLISLINQKDKDVIKKILMNRVVREIVLSPETIFDNNNPLLSLLQLVFALAFQTNFDQIKSKRPELPIENFYSALLAHSKSPNDPKIEIMFNKFKLLNRDDTLAFIDASNRYIELCRRLKIFKP